MNDELTDRLRRYGTTLDAAVGEAAMPTEVAPARRPGTKRLVVVGLAAVLVVAGVVAVALALAGRPGDTTVRSTVGVGSTASPAPGVVKGDVIDVGGPAPGGTYPVNHRRVTATARSAPGRSYRTMTGPDGSFRLRIPAGRYRLCVARQGQARCDPQSSRDVELASGQIVTVHFVRDIP